MRKKQNKLNVITVFGLIAAVLLVVSAFTGCKMEAGSEEAVLSIQLQAAGGSRAVGDNVDTARLYLISKNGAYYEFKEDTLYYEETVPGSIEVEVPAGSWTVALELGKGLTNGALLPTDYGVSPLIYITPGPSPNSVVITTGDTPFTWWEAQTGTDFNGVVTIGSDIYASTGSKLYEGTTVTDLAEISPAFNYSGYSIESISKGTYFNISNPLEDYRNELWVNTNKGIVPLWANGFKYDFQNTQFPVVKSGGYFDPADIPNSDPSDLTLFYKTESSFGGLDITPDFDTQDIPEPSTWTWSNNDDFAGSFTGELVYEFFIHGGYTYFATKIGTFRMDNSVTATGGGDFITLANEISIAGEEAGSAIPIYGLNLLSGDPDADTPEGSTIMMATESGVFTATLTGDDTVITDLKLIPGTAGKSFTKTAVSDESGTYAAAASSTGLFLFKKTASDYTAKEFPVYAGLPGSISAVEFKENSHVLVIGGKEGILSPDGGIVQIDADSSNLSW